MRKWLTIASPVGVAVLFAAVLAMGGCSDPKTARKALDSAGFTEIQTGGYDFFECGKDDSFATSFTAKNPNGKTVTGTVCSGWFKGATIRFD